jgi:hypothetical protein
MNPGRIQTVLNAPIRFCLAIIYIIQMHYFNLYAYTQSHPTPYTQGPFVYVTPRMYICNLPQMTTICPLNINHLANSEINM